jgi:hypothetical protein
VIEDRLANHAAGEPLDDRTDPGRTEPLVELTPADDAVVGCELQKMVIPPAGVAAKDFQVRDSHRTALGIQISRA